MQYALKIKHLLLTPNTHPHSFIWTLMGFVLSTVNEARSQTSECFCLVKLEGSTMWRGFEYKHAREEGARTLYMICNLINIRQNSKAFTFEAM